MLVLVKKTGWILCSGKDNTIKDGSEIDGIFGNLRYSDLIWRKQIKNIKDYSKTLKRSGGQGASSDFKCSSEWK